MQWFLAHAVYFHNEQSTVVKWPVSDRSSFQNNPEWPLEVGVLPILGLDKSK